jgi:hypothetical protein
MKSLNTLLAGLTLLASGLSLASESRLPPVTEADPFAAAREVKKVEAKRKAETKATAAPAPKAVAVVRPAPAPRYEKAGSLAPEDSDLYSVYNVRSE